MLLDLASRDGWNFLLTNYLPRRLATRLMGWYSRIDSRWLTAGSIALWRLFVDRLDFSEAQRPAGGWRSLRDCFIRELKPGARPIAADPGTLVSPCDAVLGAHGELWDGQLLQVKGSPYALADLVPDAALVERFRDGRYATLRLRSTMYHRFHAPADCQVDEVIYVAGDTYNVNPPTLRRIQRLFTRNERAVLPLRIDGEIEVLLVPVAAILVASLRLHCLQQNLDMHWRGPQRLDCDAHYARGAEMGWFEHGSTIIVLARRCFAFVDDLREGAELRMGRPLLRRVTAATLDPAPEAA